MRILTQHPVEIALSVPAMEHIVDHLSSPVIDVSGVQCEVDNFLNLLRNLIERSEPLVINNEDLL